MMNERLLEVNNLVKHFPHGRAQWVKAVNGISFQIERGEAVALVGESGSGKTTAGRCILRLIESTAGTIFFRGQDITAMSQAEFRSLRPFVQMVFQEPYDSLNPRMRIGTIIEEPLLQIRAMSARQRGRRVLDLLDMVKLGSSFFDKYPHQLSGGEQQRAGIARAISTQPDLIVLDEPTSALDVSMRAEILDLLTQLQRQLGLAYLLISHDLTAVRRVCSRIAIMYLGKIVESGETEEVFSRSLHPYSKALLSSVLYPNPAQKGSRFLLKGEIPSPINLPLGCHLYARCPWARDECDLEFPPLEELLPSHRVACFRAREENKLGTDSTSEIRSGQKPS